MEPFRDSNSPWSTYIYDDVYGERFIIRIQEKEIVRAHCGYFEDIIVYDMFLDKIKAMSASKVLAIIKHGIVI